MLIRIEQLNPIIGDLSGNQKKILGSLDAAENDHVDLLILQELVTIGYPALDLLENGYFRKCCYELNEKLIASTNNCALLFGSITENVKGIGRKMYNSAILAEKGVQVGLVHKTLLPTYDVFDDLRYFEPNDRFEPVVFRGLKLGVTICEDIWYNENEVQYHTYEIDPASILKEKGSDMIINISASPYTLSKHENRVSMLMNHAKKLKIPILYSNQTGAHTEIIFDGDSMAVSGEAEVIANTETFDPDFTDIEWDKNHKDIRPAGAKKSSQLKEYPEKGPERQFLAIKRGIQDYLEKTGITGDVIIGLSGGIDSALVCALASEALGPGKVKALTMPSQFSSDGSVSDSEKLATNLGIELFTISIEQIFKEFESCLHPVFGNLPFGTAEENLQSRIRGTLLMAYANKFGLFLLATGNKSEYAVGYATLYGDMNGALAVIGDLYKTEVYEMSNWLNHRYFGREVIPEAIITKEPSAELKPDQKDSDSLPDYNVLDEILYRYIELQHSAKKIITDGIDSDTVQKVIKLVERSEFKRYQAAPILKLSSKSFGAGRRWPLVQRWTQNETELSRNK